MNAMISPPTRHQFNYFKLLSNILKVHRVIPSVTVQYATNIDAIDAFTSDLILKHKAKLNGDASITVLQFNSSKNKNKFDMTDDELDSLISNLLSQNKDKYIEKIAIECMNSRRFINEATLKKLFRHYSLLGKPDMITILQKYCSKVDPNLYRRNAEFKHYLAKAQCFMGNSEKGLSILKDCYIHFENRRSMYRIILRELIQDSVLHRSEASLVIFKRYVKEFSDIWGDHYPLVCLWHICWTSSWFSDQVLADELLEYSGNLRDIVKDKATEFSITVLNDYNEDAVMRLLQSLLKYVMIDEYAKVLQVLFTYKLKHRDIRGCAEIIRNCEVLGITIPSDQQGQYIKMLITGEVDDKPVKPIRPSLKNFKLKF